MNNSIVKDNDDPATAADTFPTLPEEQENPHDTPPNEGDDNVTNDPTNPQRQDDKDHNGRHPRDETVLPSDPSAMHPSKKLKVSDVAAASDAADTCNDPLPSSSSLPPLPLLPQKEEEEEEEQEDANHVTNESNEDGNEYEDDEEDGEDETDRPPSSSSSSSTRTPWSAKIALLKKFKTEHSHCRVPQRSDAYPQLAQFTKKMRELYRLIQQGTYKGKILTPERIQELEELGFEWEVRKVKNKTFDERIRDLNGFKEKYGHCNVPRVFEEDVSLGRWCHVMRCSYRQIKENQKPMYKLQPEEIQRLEEMGFQWRIRPRKSDVGDGIKEEEKNDQVGEEQAVTDSAGQGPLEEASLVSKSHHKITSFEERIEQLKQYKKEHGHLRVTMGQNKNLAIFVNHMRGARRDPNKTNGVKLTQERIDKLDELGFDWAPPRTKIRWSAKEGKEDDISFERRLEQLKNFKEKHGHVNVTRKDDQKLAAFCNRMRAEKNAEDSTLTDDQIKALDEIGFQWEIAEKEDMVQPWVTFEDRLEQLKAFKEEHGHFRVTAKYDRALALFCSDVRSAHRPGSKKKLTEERTKALDDIGFEWNPPKTVQPISFEARLQQLKEFKDTHGHLRVTEKMDKKLAAYCNNLRQARRKPEAGIMIITDDRIKALDELGFEWNIIHRNSTNHETKTFEDRVEELKAYKEAHGDLNVTPKFDRSLSNFCKSIRAARRNPNSGRQVTEERIKILDEIGFPWEVPSVVTSFEDRISQLKAFKEKHGHLKVTNKIDKQLASWCSNMRAARRNPQGSGLHASEERINVLDEIGFEWEVSEGSGRNGNASFQSRLAQLKEFKEKNGHVNVLPSDDKALARYCTRIRKARRDPEGSSKFHLSNAMTNALDEIGFDWDMDMTSENAAAVVDYGVYTQAQLFDDPEGDEAVGESENQVPSSTV
eukprot:CAMPEP_0176491316 /NCGR_PEP_ID=MMETSP0200_2-20121128/8365_1 /TAXON_ID=947934 /ORGANISM="Chaetoceros sp., Strain GSL56" /LENGTH=932 /DNA_ID=CAMNT_0017888733 /DNA_START=77 /DNA_END=2875 /DNA_ORIENTATION=-